MTRETKEQSGHRADT
jgi:hypothetical protein